MLRKLFISLVLLIASSSSLFSFSHYVNTPTLKVRVAPASSSDHSYSIYKGHKVTVYEMKNGWARISKNNTDEKWVHGNYLTAIKIKEQSNKKKETALKEIVEETKNTPISATIIEPAIKTEIETETKTEIKVEEIQIKEQKYDKYALLLEVLSTSDDYEKFKPTFISTSKRLYDNGTCKLKDFKRSRGWMELADNSLYFIYCGSIKKSNKIYLNVITGKATK